MFPRFVRDSLEGSPKAFFNPWQRRDSLERLAYLADPAPVGPSLNILKRFGASRLMKQFVMEG